MNILFLIEERVSSGFDGHATYLQNLCVELTRNNHNIFIIYNKKNEFYNILTTLKLNVQLIYISSRNLKNCLKPQNPHIKKFRMNSKNSA